MTEQTIPELFNLTGKSAIVTGGAKGIGQSIALRLAEAGASVMVSDIDMEACEKTVAEIKDRSGKAQAIHADAGSVDDAEKVVQATVDTFGHLDILVNNAGVLTRSPVLEVSEEIWDEVLNTNLRGVFFYSQTFAQHMVKASHGGKIINIASMDAFHPEAHNAAYNIAKAGVVMLTKSLALDYAPYKILVNAVAPGAIQTPGVQRVLDDFVAAGVDVEELMKPTEARMLLNWGKPDDMAKIVLFLASAASDYMTGSVILADGGFLLT